MARTGIRIIKQDVSGIRRIKAMDLVLTLGHEVAQEMAKDVVASFGTGKQGKTHFIQDERFPSGILHTASAPEEPPNILTSDLANSIKAVGVARLSWHIQDGVPYGIDLEIGDFRSNTAPRPFMGPIFELWRKGKFRRFGESLIRDAIK